MARSSRGSQRHTNATSTRRQDGIDGYATGDHVALLFLTIDDLPHEHIWREWLTGSDDDGDGDGDECVIVSVICHAKHPERIRSDWLRRRHLLRRECASSAAAGRGGGGGGGGRGGGGSTTFHTRRPEWGSVDTTKAMMDLLEEGLRIGGITENVGDYRRYLSTPSRTRTHEATSGPDASVDDDAVPPPPPVDRFVFVSESCLPLTTLREFEMALFGPRDDPEDDDAGSVVVATGKQSSSKEGQSPYDKSWIRARSTPNNGYARRDLRPDGAIDLGVVRRPTGGEEIGSPTTTTTTTVVVNFVRTANPSPGRAYVDGGSPTAIGASGRGIPRRSDPRSGRRSRRRPGARAACSRGNSSREVAFRRRRRLPPARNGRGRLGMALFPWMRGNLRLRTYHDG